ncbi:MAG: HAMP domain-containing histidine kinase [Candidatus Riflebacteria bacterium]|nr:HAMP domain-containing histidine kinase [Candidatus Riflebacteria bacterium]
MRRRIMGLSIGLVLLFSISTGLLHFWRMAVQMRMLAAERLRSIVATAAAGVDGDAHAELNRCLDKNCPNYRKLAGFLRQVQSQNGLSTEVYTLARTATGTRFVLRTEHESDFGMPYELRPEMRLVFERGELVTTGVYEDRWGSWMSAYAPIVDSAGHVVALLEADYRAEELSAMVLRDVRDNLLLWLLGLALTVVLGNRLSRQLTMPLAQLTRAVDATGEGEEHHPLPLEAPAELGMLARRFQAMREAVAQARARERLATVGQMAGAMIHDLRGPLMVVSGMTELIQGEDSAEERADLVRRVLEQVRRIEAMARDVLEFSRGTSHLELGRFRAAGLVDGIAEDATLLARQKGVQLRVETGWDGEVEGDPDKLRRVTYNLTKNAIEATPSGKSVVLKVSGGEGRWQMQVCDAGPGLPPEVANRLFEAFATHGKKGGTGLGLAIVKSIVERHSGTVTHRPGPEGGAVFSVDLPVSQGEPTVK